jgi:hypothetical protein
MHADIGSGLVPQIPHELDQFAATTVVLAHFRSIGVEVGDILRDPVDERRERSTSLPGQYSAHSS